MCQLSSYMKDHKSFYSDRSPARIGLVIMASGHSIRFGSNKLLAMLNGRPLLSYVLTSIRSLVLPESALMSDQTHLAGPVFLLYPLAVTRSKEVLSLCDEHEIPCILHDQPLLSDTIQIGLSSLIKKEPDLCACMFLQGDQPLLKAESINNLILEFLKNPGSICRLSQDGTGKSPVLFPASCFEELQNLPADQGGNVILKKYPEKIRLVEAGDPTEFLDADTPAQLQEIQEQETTRISTEIYAPTDVFC